MARTSEEHFVFEITSWSWDYTFGVNNVPGLLQGLYLDFRHLVIQAIAQRPKKIAGLPSELTIVPDPKLVGYFEPKPGQREKLLEIGICGLHASKTEVSCTIGIPADALPPVLTVLAAGKLRFVVASGPPLERGATRVRTFSLREEHDPRDLPSETEPNKTQSKKTRKRPTRSPRLRVAAVDSGCNPLLGQTHEHRP